MAELAFNRIYADSPDGGYADLSDASGNERFAFEGNTVLRGFTNTWAIAVWVYQRAYGQAGSEPGTNFVSFLPTSGLTNQIAFGTAPGEGSAYPQGQVRAVIADATQDDDVKQYRWGLAKLNDWVHYVLQWNGTELYLWINGVYQTSPVKQIDEAVTQTNVLSHVAIGGSTAGSLLLDGNIHSVAVWDAWLTQSEIRALWCNGWKDFPLDQPSLYYAKHGNLVHWWKLGAVAGSRAGGDTSLDDVASGGMDTDLNAVAIDRQEDAFSWPNVVQGRSVALEGGVKYMSTVSAQSLAIGDSWTIQAWVRVDTAGGAFFTAQPATGNANKILLASTLAGNFYAQLWDENGDFIKSYQETGTITTGTWYHVAATWDGSANEFKPYVNGVDRSPYVTKLEDLTGTLTNTARIFDIGTRGPTAFAGRASSGAIWSSVLTADEIAEIYQARELLDLEKAGRYYASSSSLVSWWQLGLDLEFADVGKDQVGSVNLTAVGMTETDLRGLGPYHT